MKNPFQDEKFYRVECPACDISEMMVFRKSKIGIVWRHSPTVCFNPEKDGMQEQVFDSVKGVLGDAPPKKCPKCGGALKITNISACVRH